jgi:tetratricopeptide (TPR) repeat protein
VRRLVALKILKPGMDTRQVVARFEAERQALALMDHPHIAHVFDGSETASGRPYFVMELVKGTPIAQYCDEQRLTPRQRLELFVPVCQAIQHAHQKGIIHRDLKPSNVLVAPYDDQAVVKVIDFGVAKATGQRLTDRTLFTGFGTVVGTLEYMSPEQAVLNNQDIDTRSDVYSLGVLLYELLTGTTPLERKRAQDAGLVESLRIIREEETPRPSARLSTLAELPRIAADRGLEPKKLNGLVRGELDWIVMKALEKDRNRRYETANSFAADVQSYLHDEPVQACPPSAWYRGRKFALRHRTALAVAGLILLFIALLGGGAGWALSDRAARQARAANELEFALERGELFLGQGKRAEALTAFDRAELLASQVPGDPARDARLAALKERLAAEARDQQFSDRFEEIRRVQSRIDLEQDRFAEAATYPEIRDALHQYGIAVGVMAPAEVVARIQGRPEPVSRDLVAALDECLRLAPKEDVQARQWLLAALAVADPDAKRRRARQAALGQDWKTLEQWAREADVSKQPPSFLIFVAISLPAQMKPARLELLRRTQRAHPADLWANHWLASELVEDGRPVEAIRYYTAALALRPDSPGIYVNRGFALRRAGEVDAAIADFRQSVALAPAYATAHYNLGTSLSHKGQLDEAIAEYREAISLNKDYFEAQHNLGTALRAKGLWEEAIAAYREVIRVRKDDPLAHYSLGLGLEGNGGLDEAIAAYRQAISLKGDYADAHTNLSNALYRKGRLDEAIAAYRQAIRVKKDDFGLHNNLGIALARKGRLVEAITAFGEAIRLKEDFAMAHYNLGNAQATKGQLDEAIQHFRRAIALDPMNANTQNQLGIALYSKGQLDEAIQHHRRAIALDPMNANAHNGLGNTLTAKGQPDEAIAEHYEAIRLQKDDPSAHNDVGRALQAKGLLDEAIAEYREAIRLNEDFAMAHHNLGNALKAKGLWDEAIAAYRQVLRLQKDDPSAHNNVGNALQAKGLLDEAIAEYREATRLNEDFAMAHHNLGNALRAEGLWNEAIAAYRQVLRLQKNDPSAHNNVGRALQAKGLLDEAIAEYREAIRLNEDYAMAHYNLGNALKAKGLLDEAIAAYCQVLRLQKNDPSAHNDLGNALQAKGLLDEAIAEYREAIRLNEDYAMAHYNLGNALRAKGFLDEAIAAYRQALRLNKDYAEAQCNLGHALRQQGKFREALEALRRGDQLGSRDPRWPYPSAKWVRQCERLVELDGQLPGFLEGKTQPASPAERVALAELCSVKRLHRASARFYEEAFAAQPNLADDPATGHRYNAACAAALAGCGQGQDAGPVDEGERARLRRQALDWLRADLTARKQLLEKQPEQARASVQETLRHWQRDADFAGVRGHALDKLPEAERQLWRQLWEDVGQTLTKLSHKSTKDAKEKRANGNLAC